MNPTRDRIRGMFLGIAIGDALGVPVETYDAARIEHEYGAVTTYIQNPTHKWSATRPAGMWSDDTQLTLAVAESIIETGILDLTSQAKWHLRLLDEYGDLGLGGSTRDALDRVRAGIYPTESGKTDNPKRGMGNALPMKVAPVGAYAASGGSRYSQAVSVLQDFVGMTHYTCIALQSAMAHVRAVEVCLCTKPQRFTKAEFMWSIRNGARAAHSTHLLCGPQDLDDRFALLQALDTNGVAPRLLPNIFSGDQFLVYNSLPVAYGCFLSNPLSIASIFAAIAAGGDTDTNASIVGSLFGALHGAGAFPAHLVEGLQMRKRIMDTAERLCERLGIKE